MAKSEVYSFRLHPSDDREAEAIRIIQGLQDKGFSIRAIMTDAVLRADGRTPEMYRQSDDHISRGFIESILSEFAEHIVVELRASGRMVEDNQPKPASPFGEDEDATMAQNLANSYVNRRKRGK